MANKFIRAFLYGLEDGDTIVVTINGQQVEFTIDAAQQDIEINVAPEGESTPAN